MRNRKYNMKEIAILILLSSLFFQCTNRDNEYSEQEKAEDKLYKPVIKGDWAHIFNPNETRSEIDTTWYTNDHCFIKGSDNKWHAYGIIGHKPIDPWKGETKFFHISTDSLTSNHWEDHDYALKAKEGVEKVLWAPHIFLEDGIYNMFYNAGNLHENAANFASWGTLHKAVSTDMFSWKRHEFNPLFSGPGHARDSFLMKYKEKYFYYYTGTVNSVDLRSTVMLRTGSDLAHWSGPRIVHIEPPYGHWGGNTESPVVINYMGKFYLFICYASEYNRILVYWSNDPTDFPKENFLCELNAHAPEIIDGREKGWFISNTGWDKKGLFLASLIWEEIKEKNNIENK